MQWLVLGILSLIFLLSPYQRGLFFSEDIYMLSVVLTIIIAVWLIFSFFSKSNSVSGGYLFIFLLPLIYYLTFMVAESPKGNFDALFRWLAYSSFFVLLVWLRKEEKIEKLLPYLFQVCGIAISFFALFGLWGWVDYQDVLLGNRLTGPFQYPNTFAAVIAAFWLYSLVVLTREKLAYYTVTLFGISLVAYGVGFFHSYSRGVLVVFPIAWLIGLFCLRIREQVFYVCYSILSVVGSFIVFIVMVEQEQVKASAPGIGTFLLITIIVMCLVLLLTNLNKWAVWAKIQERISEKSTFRLVLPVTVLVVVLLLWLDLENEGAVYKQLPEGLQQQVTNITTETASALGRTNMYKDAWEMSKDSPLLGLGGEGWRVLFTQYQSLPYWSTQVHNGYLQLLLDTGWLGLLLFVLVFAYLFWQIIYRVWQGRTGSDRLLIVAVLPALAMLFLHSALDFNFSYGTVWFVIMWLFAMGAPYQPVAAGGLGQIVQKLANVPWRNKALVIGKVALILAIFIGTVYAYRFHLAHTNAAGAAVHSDAFAAAQAYQGVVSTNPYDTRYLLTLGNIYATIYAHTQEEEYKQQMVEVLNRAEKLEPLNPELLHQLGQVYGITQEWEKQKKYLDQALAYDRFNVQFYDTSIQFKAQVAAIKTQQDHAEAEKWVESAVKDYEIYNEWYQEWKDEVVPDRRPININRETRIQLANTYVLLEHYVEGLNVLRAANANITKSLYTEEDGIIVKVEPFQVLRLTDFLKRNSDNIMVLSVRDEGSHNLSKESKDFLGTIGSKISELRFRGSFLAVIVDGKVILEKIDNSNAIEMTNSTVPSLNDVFLNKSFALLSAGKEYGDRSSIIIDGEEYSPNILGINIAVFDKQMNHIESINFNTYQSDVNVIPLRD